MPRFNAQRFFLTYSAVADESITSALIANYLHLVINEPSGWIEVNRELHADGTPHYHAVVTSPVRFRGQLNAFDFRGYHPNVRAIKNGKHDLGRCRDYIRKDGIDNLESRGPYPDYVPHAEEVERHTWGELLASANSGEFLRNCADWFPKEYILRQHDILAFAQQHYNAPSDYIPDYPRDTYIVPPAADQWVADVLGEVSYPWLFCYIFLLILIVSVFIE